MSLETSYETFWGNSIQGFYITWNNVAADSSGTIDASTELDFDLDLRLYALAALDSSAITSGETLNFYFLFQNPIDKVAYDTAIAASPSVVLHYNTWVTFDGMYGTLDISESVATPPVISLDTLSLVDIWCPASITEGAYDSSSCKADTDGASKTNGN